MENSIPTVSVVVPTYSRYDLLTSCIDGLLTQTLHNLEIIVVDNASITNINQAIQQRYGTRVTTLRLGRNLFFCGAVNRGAAHATGEFLAVINDDCVVTPEWAETAVRTLRLNPQAASIASLVVNASDPRLINSAGDHLDISGRATNLHWNQRVSDLDLTVKPVFHAAGSCALYRRELFELAGGFDSDFIAYLDDIDLGFRLQLQGYSTIFNPHCLAAHVGGGTPKSRKYAARLLERNMIWNLIKNLPSELWARHRKKILVAQSVPAPLIDGISIAGWSQGKTTASFGLFRMLAKRHAIQASRQISIADLEALLLQHDVRHCHL